MGKKILIIEDDPAVRESLKLNLSFLGHEVLLAPDGRLGLQMARREKPDLILLDISLPEITGDNLCVQLKSGMPTASIPVVLITGVGTESLRKSVGADDILEKPFQFSDLRQLIDKYLE